MATSTWLLPHGTHRETEAQNLIESGKVKIYTQETLLLAYPLGICEDQSAEERGGEEGASPTMMQSRMERVVFKKGPKHSAKVVLAGEPDP